MNIGSDNLASGPTRRLLNSPSFSNAASKVKRKRNRIPLSCTICRKRKVKCDKNRPHCDQCTKTGVSHLCHYMEQTWAEEAEKELTKEAELKQLRDRVKTLEDNLSRLHATYNSRMEDVTRKEIDPPQQLLVKNEDRNLLHTNTLNSPATVHSAVIFSGSSKYDDDELDLTRDFDMLHLKNNGTIHLGATHWLAIMKGDPYLKLLWGHIFTMREKLNEWYSQKKNPVTDKKADGCPVIHNTSDRNTIRQINDNSDAPNRCPVIYSSGAISPHPATNATKKCPVNHTSYRNLAPKITRSTDINIKNCPVDHTQFTKSRINKNIDITPHVQNNGQIGRPSSSPAFTKISSKCPVNNNDDSGNAKKKQTSLELQNSMTQTDIIKRICDLLPPQGVIAMYVEHFFNHLYPVIPILDEHTFKIHISRLFGTNILSNSWESIDITMSTKIQTLNLNRGSDCCNIGILLIILRLTWLSLPSNSCTVDLGAQNTFPLSSQFNKATVNQAKDDAILSQYEPSVEAIELVRKYLIKFDELSSVSNSNVNLTTVQFAIFFKLFLMCCPGDNSEAFASPTNCSGGMGQDNESHQVLLSSIIQMSFSCGLHRDPDNFPQLNTVSGSSADVPTTVPINSESKTTKQSQLTTERFKHTWRKIWYYVISLDVQQSISLGTPRLLRNLRDFSDTKLPSASKIDYVRDIKELIIVKNLTLFFQIDLVLISVLNHILNISIAKSVHKFELDALIGCLKDLTYGTKNICDVLSQLVNKGLLYTVEGKVDQTTDELYGLPSLEEILVQQNISPVENDIDRKLDLTHESLTKALFFSKHLTIRMLLYILNYILFTHYEPMGSDDPGTISVSKYYAQETLNYAMEGYRNCLLFFTNVSNGGNVNSIFNYMEVVLAPQCLDIGNRTLQFIVCLILRAKCGPLTGMGESAILTNEAGSICEEDSDLKSINDRESSNQVLQDVSKDIELDAGEQLASILTSRMVVFGKLTTQLSSKYQYARRMMKSTGFFIALLGNSGKSNVGSSKNSTNMSGFSKMSGFFKNVPSLILSGDKESLKRCPVYQDALGFVVPKSRSMMNLLNAAQQGQKAINMHTQLPPIKSYKPVTYSNGGTHQGSEPEESEAKRRKVFDETLIPDMKTEFITSPLPTLQPATPKDVNMNHGMLPSLDKIANGVPLIPLDDNVNGESNVTTSQSENISSYTNLERLPTLTSPSSDDSINNSNSLVTGFEDFLMQNSNFNGLMINPSSIVEAVGINLENNDIPLGLDTTDFLPIDNIGIEGLPDLNNIDLSLWD